MLAIPVVARPVLRGSGARGLPSEGVDQSYQGPGIPVYPVPSEGVDQSLYIPMFPSMGVDQSIGYSGIPGVPVPSEGVDQSGYSAVSYFLVPSEGASF